MKKYTLKIDNKDSLYKKLIKLPTTYYILKENDSIYTVHSHTGMVELGDNTDDVKLKWENNEIVLYKGNSPLQLNGENFIIEQEAIISASRDDVMDKLRAKPVGISLYNIKDTSYFGIELYISRHNRESILLNFINFNDENDPILQKIKKETGGLYFTIEDDNIYISDKDGKCLSVLKDGSCYQYQYTQNEYDTLQISEILTIIESLTKTEQCNIPEAITKAEQNFTLQQGEKLSDDIYEAKIMSSGKLIATLPKIGYNMLSGELIIYDHITKVEVKIPRDFHYLKVVKSSNNDDYKLTFCNFLGNEFFEYKRYDPQYSNIPDEYQYINLNSMKKEYKPNFCKLLSHKPSFFIAEGTTNSDSLAHHPADVFELQNSGKGKKIARLIDQFGSFNKEGKFQYCDYHTKVDCGVYDSYKINKEHTAADTNNEFYLTENDSIVLYTIPELFK